MNFINENDESKSGKIVVGYIQDDNSIYASEEVAGHDELFDLYSFTPSPGIYKNSWRFNKEKKILFFWDLPEEDKIERVKSYLKRKNYTVNSVESLRDYTGDDFKLAMYLSHGDAYDDYPKPIKPAKLKSYTFDPNEPSIAEYTDYYSHLNEDLRSESDDYYYHVTLAPFVENILANGLQVNRKPTVSNYVEHSRGKIFLCDVGVVDWWKHNIEQHAFHQYDDSRFHKVAVVKIKKDKLSDVYEDEIGSEDSRGNCYYVTKNIPANVIEIHEQQEEKLNSIKEINNEVLDQMVVVAQKEYDYWVQDEHGHNEELGRGGICHLIADELITVLYNHNIENCQTVCSAFEQHVYVVGKFAEGVYEIDIPYSIYETGGGFTWKKIPNVVFERGDIVISRLDSDPDSFEQYVEEI